MFDQIRVRSMPTDETESPPGVKKTGALSAGEDVHSAPRLEVATQLGHRVSNMLAVVRSIARRTAETSRTVEEYAMNFDGRLGAYSRFLALAANNADGFVDFGYLLAEELLAVHAHEGDQVTVSGPSLQLKPHAAEIIGLAFHELATNAIKHGAFGQRQGKVAVLWHVERNWVGETLVFDWRESCAPEPALIPRHRGFGFELLERTLAFQLDAQTELHFGKKGLRCQIRIPVRQDTFVLPLGLRPEAE